MNLISKLFQIIKMGGSQHKAAVKALHQDLYLAENWEGVTEMRDGSQEISYFEIEYHKNIRDFIFLRGKIGMIKIYI